MKACMLLDHLKSICAPVVHFLSSNVKWAISLFFLLAMLIGLYVVMQHGCIDDEDTIVVKPFDE